jgi:hypothetical protein
MFTRKVLIITALAMILFMVSSAFCYETPGRRQYFSDRVDDHPWGGELCAGDDGYPDSHLAATYIDVPFTILDFLRAIVYLKTKTDLPIIRSPKIQPGADYNADNHSASMESFFFKGGRKGN